MDVDEEERPHPTYIFRPPWTHTWNKRSKRKGGDGWGCGGVEWDVSISKCHICSAAQQQTAVSVAHTRPQSLDKVCPRLILHVFVLACDRIRFVRLMADVGVWFVCAELIAASPRGGCRCRVTRYRVCVRACVRALVGWWIKKDTSPVEIPLELTVTRRQCRHDMHAILIWRSQNRLSPGRSLGESAVFTGDLLVLHPPLRRVAS